MTLKAQVEAFIGSWSDTLALDQWLTDATRMLVDAIPPIKADEFRTAATITKNTPLNVGDRRVLDVSVGNHGAIRISAEQQGRYKDTGSMHLASVLSPVYWIEGGQLKTFPVVSDGLLYGIAYPTVQGTDAAITAFPVTLVPAVVLGAAIKCAKRKMNDVALALSGIIFQAGVTPTPPLPPSFVAQDAVVASIAQSLITPDGTAPVYTGSVATVPDVSLGTLSAPTPPDAPAFSFTGIDTSLFTSLVLGSTLDLATQLDKAALYIDTDQDIELASAKLAEVRERINQFQANLQGMASNALEGAKLSGQASQFNAASALDMQVKQYSSQLQKFSEQVALYKTEIDRAQTEKSLILQAWTTDRQTTLQSELNRYNADREVYQASLQKAISQAQLDQARLSDIAKSTTEVSVQNEASELGRQVKQYEAQLSLHSQAVALYQASVQAEVQRITTAIGQVSAQSKFLEDTTVMLEREYQMILSSYMGVAPTPPTQKGQ